MTRVANRRSLPSTMRVLPPAVDQLVVLLAAASATAGLLTVVVPGILTGTTVMNGSARGTGLVVALVAVPALLVTAARSRSGSVRAASACLGSSAYLTYNAVMFCFATPINRLFLVYVVMLSAGVFLLANLVPVLSRSTAAVSRPMRWVGWWMLLVVGLNGALWLQQAMTAMVSDHPVDSLSSTGLTTNPVWVQDLAVWLPVMAWLALGMVGGLRTRPALVAAGLFFWVVEALGIAVDQWWGHQADPTSAWASSGAVWLFLATAVVGLVPLAVALRELPAGSSSSARSRKGPTRAAARPDAAPRPRMPAD